MVKIYKTSKVRTICPTCQYTFETDYVDSFTTAKCPFCLNVYSIDSVGRALLTSNRFYKRYRDVVAFGRDKITGEEVALDTRGRRVETNETRYDLKKDQRGWRATGKKVKGYARQ